jgi:hypothetical protein
VATQFFRVDGADQQTGEDTYLVLQAATKPQAEKLARQQGLLISSVRIAKATDWAAPEEPEQVQSDVETTQYIEPGFYEVPGPAPEAGPEASADAPPVAEPEPFVDAAPTPDSARRYTPTSTNQEDESSSPSGGATAAAIVLGCAGAALLIGGVLALALALWPDNALRNELQQIDFRLHELSQTVLGGALVLGGLIVLAMSLFCYLAPRKRD